MESIRYDSVKDMIDLKMRKGIWSIFFSYTKIYVGEIGSSLKVRLKEITLSCYSNWIKSNFLLYIMKQGSKPLQQYTHYELNMLFGWEDNNHFSQPFKLNPINYI